MKRSSILVGICLLALAFACASGERGQTSSAAGQYALSEDTSAELADDPETLNELESVLTELFGEPDAPRFAALDAWPATGFDPNSNEDLAAAGRLFSAFCWRCHGMEGGGNGPMASRLIPRPRDYRRGVFKFAAVESASKPRRSDLLRTLVHGLPGSAMPSFRRLSTDELNALVDYVRLLSIRGEVETILLADWLDRDVPPQAAADEIYELVWSRWRKAEQHALAFTAPEPDPDPLRWELGQAIFLDQQRGNCVSCHGADGRGDGPLAIRTDADGKRFALLRDEWGNFILPRDLTLGIFRGGERREDIYLRVHCGIPGTPMPSIGTSVDAHGDPLLTDEETWALVDYVLSLSGKGPLAR